MVMTAGRGWRLAPSLVALVQEANRHAPNRSKASDGSIGDPAHRARVSDHNPSQGIVHAVDLTHSPGRGFDAHAHARAVIARRDPRIKYVISDRRIYGPGSRFGWAGGPYSGSNPHTSHAHFSVWPNAAGRNNTGPWLTDVRAPIPVPEPKPIPEPVKTPPPAEDEEDDMGAYVRASDTGAVFHFTAEHWRHMSPRVWANRQALAAVAGKPIEVQPMHSLQVLKFIHDHDLLELPKAAS